MFVVINESGVTSSCDTTHLTPMHLFFVDYMKYLKHLSKCCFVTECMMHIYERDGVWVSWVMIALCATAATINRLVVNYKIANYFDYRFEHFKKTNLFFLVTLLGQ